MNMSEPQPQPQAQAGAVPAERANGAPRGASAPAQTAPAAAKAERFGAAPPDRDAKHAHKTYVRGGARQHQRSNNRR